jgi:hypothetical protein
MADREITLSASQFKAQCLAMLRKLDAGKLTRLIITKRGNPIAVIQRVQKSEKPYKSAYGFLRGTVRFAPNYDPFQQVVDEPDDPFIGKVSRTDAA